MSSGCGNEPEAAPERIAVIWSPEARTDLRAIERETAIQIPNCVDRYLAVTLTEKGSSLLTGFRLRCGAITGYSSITGT